MNTNTLPTALSPLSQAMVLRKNSSSNAGQSEKVSAEHNITQRKRAKLTFSVEDVKMKHLYFLRQGGLFVPERKFSVCGQTVTVCDVDDSYNSLRLWFNQEAINVARGFEEKYDSYGNIDSFIRHIDEVHDYIQELMITALDRIISKSRVCQENCV